MPIPALKIRQTSWNAAAAALAACISAPANPTTIAHLQQAAIIGKIGDARLEKAAELAEASGTRVLGRGQSNGTQVIIFAECDPDQVLLSPAMQRRFASIN